MNVYLTGATGFIGKHIFRALERAGHTVIPHGYSTHGKLHSLPGEIDAVVNSAGKLGGSGHPDSSLLEANLHLPLRLAEICRKKDIPLIHLSTPGVCGLRANGKETDDYAPLGIYEETKAQAETALLKIFPEISILRPDFVFGTGDMHKYPLFRQVSSGLFPLVGKGNARTRPTDADDVSSAVLRAFPGEPLHNGVFNIGGPEILTVREIAYEISLAIGKKVLFLPIPRFLFKAALKLGPLSPSGLSESRYRLFGTDRFVDTTQAAKAGFTPGRYFRQTAEAAVEWYRERELL